MTLLLLFLRDSRAFVMSLPAGKRFRKYQSLFHNNSKIAVSENGKFYNIANGREIGQPYMWSILLVYIGIVQFLASSILLFKSILLYVYYRYLLVMLWFQAPARQFYIILKYILILVMVQFSGKAYKWIVEQVVVNSGSFQMMHTLVFMRNCGIYLWVSIICLSSNFYIAIINIITGQIWTCISYAVVFVFVFIQYFERDHTL